MADFLVEAYVARSEARVEASRVEVLAEAAQQITAEGRPVRLIGSVFVPEDETFLYFFQALSHDAVRDALTRTGLRCDRVVDAVPATCETEIHLATTMTTPETESRQCRL